MKSHGCHITAECDDDAKIVGNWRAECDCGWESQDCGSQLTAKALHDEHLRFVVSGPRTVQAEGDGDAEEGL